MRMGTPSSRPSALASETSLWASLSAKAGGSYLPGMELVDQGIERKTAPGRALADRLPQRQRLDARLHAEGEGFGERTDDRIARHIVDELGHGGAADRPDIGGFVADRVEHGHVSVENVFVPADPDRELAGCRTSRTAAHGRVQHVRTLPGEDSVSFFTTLGELVDRSK